MSHLEGLGLKPTRIHRDKGYIYAQYQLPKVWLRKPAKPRHVSPEERDRLKHHMIKVKEAASAARLVSASKRAMNCLGISDPRMLG